MRRTTGAVLGLLILSLGTTGVATAQAQTTRTPAAAQTAGSVPSCGTAQLSVQIKPGSPGAGQRFATVVLTNKTATTCTVFGYGGMALLGPPAVGVPTDLRRNTTPAASTVTLTPGGSARSLLHWSAVSGPGESTSGGCEPTAPSVAVTPPNQTTAALLGWSGGAVCEHGRIDQNAYVPGSAAF